MNTLYTASIVTRCRTTGYTDAFSMSGYTSWKQVVAALRDRARHATLIRFVGVSVEDAQYVNAFQYNEDELKELIESNIG
jgi:hypothetical protein